MKISKEAYCEKCDKDVAFNIVLETRELVIRGVTVSYEHKQARCKYCGEVVFPVSYGNENFVAMMDAYKKKVGLLTSLEIREILEIRKLTQSQLANLLCIGEKDITRYLKGNVQSKSIDNMLRLIRDDIVYKRMKLVLTN
ncbi:MAG: XRE family transcriptional regulator [Bacilli bacterium]|nr:XRE family transcriptional regulator [Bacilli bacterium]